MKRVDDYLNHLYKGKRSPTDLDLKEEMKSHILDNIMDLKTEGLSEDEAITTALKLFGDEQDLKNDLKELRLTQKRKINKLKLLLISSLALGASLISVAVLKVHHYHSIIDVAYEHNELNSNHLLIDGNPKYYQVMDSIPSSSEKEIIELTHFSGDLRIFNNSYDLILNITVLNKDKEVIAQTKEMYPDIFFETDINEDLCYLVIEKKSNDQI